MTAVSPSRVVILTDFAAARGGASGLALLQARLLLKAGLAVTIFAGDSGDQAPPGAELIALGGRRLLDRRALSAAVTGLWNGAARRALTDWIACHDDARTIYHLHGFHQTLSPAVLAPLARCAARTVLHAHDYFLACPSGSFFDFRAGKTCNRRALSPGCVARHCDKRSYPQKLWRVARQVIQNRGTARLSGAATTVLIHADMAPRLRLAGRVVTIANPVEPLLAAPAVPRLAREFLYVGDLHAYKGVLVLAEAARRAGVALRFVGDGVDRARLQADYPEYPCTGWAGRAGIADAMAAARAVIAPTLGPEPFGLVPVEALQAGVPVVLSDSMLLAAGICRAGAGLAFRAGDAGDLAAVLHRLSQDDALVGALAARAPAAAAQIALTPDAWAEALQRLYHGILAPQARASAGPQPRPPDQGTR